MKNLLIEKIKSSAVFFFAVFLFAAGGYLYSQGLPRQDQITKNSADSSILNSIKGKWAGFIYSDSTGKVIAGMNISVRGDSVFGNSSVQWPKGVTTMIFRGKYDRHSKNFTFYEPVEDKRAGIYQCTLNSTNNKLSLTGTWTATRNGKQFICELDRTGNLVYATQDPAEMIKSLINNINEYCQSRDDEYLKKVYSAWLTPELRIGDFDNFKQGFSTTISDKIIPLSDYIKSKFDFNYNENPYRVDEVEGILSRITVLHEAQEYVKDGDSIKIQISTYQNEYKFIVFNGQWKILFGKAKLLERQPVNKTITTAEFLNKYNIKQISSLLEITNVYKNHSDENDTVTVSFIENPTDGIQQDIQIFFDSTAAKIIGNRILGQLQCIIPGGLNNSNPVLRIKSGNTQGPPYPKFTIGSSFFTRWYIIALLVGLIVAILIYTKYVNDKLAREKAALTQETIKLTEEKQKISNNISQLLDAGQEIIELPTPKVPPELIEACKNGDCILLASSELPNQAGYPLWIDFIFNLINWSVDNNYLTIDQKDLLISSIKSGRIEQAADSAITNLTDKGVDLTKYFSEVFSKKEEKIPEVYDELKKIPFSAAISATFDDLMERSYENNNKTLTAKDGEEAMAALNNRDFFIFKVYGDLKRPDTILLAPSQFTDAVSQNYMFSQFIENVFNSRTVFCVGANIDTIERFLKNIRFRGGAQKKHFALVGVKGTDWKTSAGILEKRFGIEVLPFTAGNNTQILDFVKELSAAAPSGGSLMKKRPDAPIKKITIENIGPFEYLELELDKHWNILLGDNGVGKSSILKAIATGLIGKDAEQFAHRLVKKGKTSSKIIIETDNATYTSDIYLKINKAELNEHPRPLDTEGWLAIAFPPLRTITWKQTSGNAPDGSKIPLSEDIIPIITGEPDPRMDKLKEWIMKLFAKSLIEQKRSGKDDDEYSRLITKFFEIVDDLTPNLMVKFSKIDPITNEVLIITEDGEIPIESISQGTLSLISWLGILIQRLYEVYGKTEEDPTKRYALVIMDEIDAHMHPEWQHTLVYSLKKVFPNIQFIVSTHSPLVVGGMMPNQLFRFTRNEEGKVERIAVEEEDALGRTDQLLTSKLFGLNTTLDKITQDDMNRYEELLGKSKRTAEEQTEFDRLESRLEFRIPPTFENSDARKVQKQHEEELNEQLSKINEKDLSAIKEKLSKLTKK